MDNKWKSVSDTGKEIAFTVVGLPLLYAFPVAVLQGAHDKHWLFGLALTLFYGYAIFLGLKDLRSFEGMKYPLLKGIRIFLLLVLLAATVFGSLSLVLSRFGWATYASELPESLYRFSAFYIGIFCDLLPGLEVRETLNWTLPVEPKGFVSGSLVLTYRALVIFGLFGSLRIWWTQRSQDQSASVIR